MAEVKRVNVDVSDLAPGQTRAIDIGGRKILLCNADGQYFAVHAIVVGIHHSAPEHLLVITYLSYF